MAKLTRVYQKIFGSSAAAGQIGKFGSLAAGTPETTTDPELVQSYANFLGGWYSAIVGGNSPAIQDMNALFFLLYRQLAYIFENGIAEYDASTTYFKGSRVVSSGVLYVSLTDNNTGNAVTNATHWSLAISAKYDAIVGSATQVTAGLATHSTWASAIAAVSAGASILALPGTWTENVTVTKQLKILGSGYGTYIDGSLTCDSSSDNSDIQSLRVNNDITLNSGADGIFISKVFFPSGKTFIDNGTGNLLEGIQA